MLGEVLTTPHLKNLPSFEMDTIVSGLDRSFATTSGMEGNMRFGTGNVRRQYRSGSVTTVATVIARYKLG